MSEHFPAELLAQLPGLLVPWFLRAKRDLEWRNDPTPYRVWISEIMLQQTRVEAVKPYYDRFLAKHPHSYKAGIATPAQISKEPLEQKDTDIQMNVVIPCREKY